MSYDLDVVIKRTLHSDNYTCNVWKMYYDAWDKVKDTLNFPCYENVEDWKDAIQLEQYYSIPTLKAMIKQLKDNPEHYKQMNPDNGWGDYEGAIKFLENAYNALLISEDAYIELSC